MGLIETRMRRFVRLGDEIDLTLIGGKEMRGRIVDYLEDGLLINENGFDRPVVFAGIATYVPTTVVRREMERREKEAEKKTEAAALSEPAAVKQEKTGEAPKVELKVEPKTEPEVEPKAELKAEEKPVIVPEIETVEEAEGWLTRYDTSAEVGAILSGEHEILFSIADVMDQALVDTLSSWLSKPQPVRFSFHRKGSSLTAKMITGRIPEANEGAPEKKDIKADESRYGFGEILYFDKKEGYGKAKEGEKKFIFKREDVSSDKLWQEIVRAGNTCGIKIAFTVKDGKYTEIREITAAVTPDKVTMPDFNAPIVPQNPGEDVNPIAKDVFTDGTMMEDKVRAGKLMFYNADKYFGRLAETGGERYYFRASDVMQKSLLDYLNKQVVVSDIEVTFSVKTLPTGKTAAGRVRWNGIPSPKKAAEKKPSENKPVPASVAETKPVVKMPDNPYLVNLMKLWGVSEEELKTRLRGIAQRSTGKLKDEILMELSALAEHTRMGRDEAIYELLQNHAAGGGNHLGGFLSTAGYDAAEMFDTLTALFAVAPGSMGRVCGLIAADADAITLRGEILKRLGIVPENGTGLSELWQPLVDAEKEKHNYGGKPYTAEVLKELDPENAHEDFAKFVEFDPMGEYSDEEKSALRGEIHEMAEEIRKKPDRISVEWITPRLEALVKALSEQAPGMRALCAVEADGVRYVCGEIEGNLKDARIVLKDMELALGEVKEQKKFAFPCEDRECSFEVVYEGGSFTKTLTFEDNFSAQEMDAQNTLNILSEVNNVVLVGGKRIPKLLQSTFDNDDNIISVSLGEVDSLRTLSARAMRGLSEGFEKNFGKSMGLMIGIQTGDPNTMTLEQLTDVAVETVKYFDDMKIVHDNMKDKTVVLTSEIAAELKEFVEYLPKVDASSVKRIMAVKDAPENSGIAKVLRRMDSNPVSALKCAGYNVSDVAVFEKQE